MTPLSSEDVFREMHDLVGLRVVPRTQQDQEKAKAFVADEFRELKPSAHISADGDVDYDREA